MSQTVPSGLFFSFTKAQLQSTILPLYQAEVQKAVKRGLTGASVSGQSFTYGEREFTLQEFQAEIQAALAYFEDGQYCAPGGNSATARPRY